MRIGLAFLNRAGFDVGTVRFIRNKSRTLLTNYLFALCSTAIQHKRLGTTSIEASIGHNRGRIGDATAK